MSERINTGAIAFSLVAAANAGARRAGALQRRGAARQRLGAALARLDAAFDAEERLDARDRRR